MITVEEMLKGDYAVFDTRTPSEYEKATIPGAYNIPILSDEERIIVGTLYKKDKEEAIELGKGMATEKVDPIVSRVRELAAGKRVVVFCWRGGMRSGGVVEFLKKKGIDALQLDGGHKAYRRYVIDRLADYNLKTRFIVLYGLTGVGKTDILREIVSPVLDLEGLAQHRSSVLGAVNLKPRTQVMFESLLLNDLESLNQERFVFIEGESRKIGSIVMPEFLFKAMKAGINVKVECPFEDRVNRIVSEYTEGDLSELKSKLDFFEKRLGKSKVVDLKMWFAKEDFDKVAAVLLKEYYDVLYKHTVDNVEYDHTVKTVTAIEELKLILSKVSS